MSNIVLKINSDELLFSTSEKDWCRMALCLPDWWTKMLLFNNYNSKNHQKSILEFIEEQESETIDIVFNIPDNLDRRREEIKQKIIADKHRFCEERNDQIIATKQFFLRRIDAFMTIVLDVSSLGVNDAKLVITPLSFNNTVSDFFIGFVKWFREKWILERNHHDIKEFMELMQEEPPLVECQNSLKNESSNYIDFKKKLTNFFADQKTDFLISEKALFSQSLLRKITLFIDFRTDKMLLEASDNVADFVRISDKHIQSLQFIPCEINNDAQWLLDVTRSHVVQGDVNFCFNIRMEKSPAFLTVNFISESGDINRSFDSVQLVDFFEVFGLPYTIEFDEKGKFKKMKINDEFNKDVFESQRVCVEDFPDMDLVWAIMCCYFVNTEKHRQLDGVNSWRTMTQDQVDVLRFLYEDKEFAKGCNNVLTLFHYFKEVGKKEGAQKLYKTFKELKKDKSWK